MQRNVVLILAIAFLGAGLYTLVRGGREGQAARKAASTAISVVTGTPRERATAKLEEGEALEQLERFDEAERSYRAATEADTSFGLASLRLGALRLVSGYRDEARAILERAIALDPKLSDAHFHMGFIHEEEGENDAAEAAYREAVRLDSANAEAYNNLGHLLTRVGRPSEAIPVLEEGRRRDPESPFLAKNLGRAYARTGAWDLARPLLEQAAPVGVRDPEVFADLACLFRATGDERQAESFFRRYLATEADSTRRAEAAARFEGVAPKKS
ncbi:MAG: tetratricopeptide repeat protein [bacterium]